ncbi:MAG: AgmX/PglI C-terminal domain-containing protein [Myxococcales bacterium]|nr:AgmX/PglI C-terminal domain-containing protein [Myxococcales bacterium]
MARARPGGDLADLAEQIDHGGAVVRAGGIHGDLGPGGVGTAADPVATPPGRIALAGGRAADATSLDVDGGQAQGHGVYMAGIKRCYKGALKTDPTLRGQLALGFTVTEHGRVTAPTATGPSDEVGTCVAAQLRTWLFPVPKDDDGEPTSASFTLELQLAPG